MDGAIPSRLARDGKRERNKREKLLRIKQAAAELFTIKGFDAATTEDIAKRAKVAKGTLFLYARDKRDLVFLIFNDEIARISQKAFARVNSEEPVLEQLISVAGVFYKGFLKNPQLSRILLAELFFYRGKLAREFNENRQRVIGRYQRLLSQAQSSGKLAAEVDTAIASRHFFLLISGSLRIWLGDDKPSLSRGLGELRRILSLSVQSMASPPQRSVASASSSPRE